MPSRSIRFSLTTAIAGLMILLVVVSVTAVVGLVRINGRIETVDRKWLVGTQMLGDLKSVVSEFRVAQGYRFLAADQPGAIQAEFLAEGQAAAIDKLLVRIEELLPDSAMADDLQRFRTAWRALLLQHRAWIDEALGEQAIKPIGYGSALQKRYELVQLAVGNLIDDARVAANAEARAADASAGNAVRLVTVLVVLAGSLALALMAHVEFQIARPLGAITTALSRLAAGDRELRVPEVHRRDEIGAMATAFEVFRANAVALADAQARAETLARHDPLTGLPNRRYFESELAAALDLTSDGGAFAAMLIDLDRFKPINDLHGHAAGDQVLCVTAARLRELVGPSGLVARLGGDEFAVILPRVADREAAAAAARTSAAEIVARLSDAAVVGRTRLAVGASIGLAVCPVDARTTGGLLRAADLAMYRAKHQGRGRFQFFEASMDDEILARAELEADLTEALGAEAIEPYYQPIVDLSTRRVTGFEVLARWRHATRGFVAPDAFIPALEQMGALNRLTRSILRRALAEASTWPYGITVAVNVSPKQFQDIGFPAHVAALLLEAGCAPRRLEIEVTETALVNNLAAAKYTLSALQELGVRVVLDDFGTGYSSLSHLRELRFDKIKIDRSFVGTMADSPGSATIVEAVLGLARNLGLPVVAEGIETPATAALLAARGCAFGQGYLFSRAVPRGEVAALLAEATPAALPA